MITSNRTNSSLAQFLCLLDEDFVFVLLDKYNIEFHSFDEIALSAALSDGCSTEDRASLFDELVRTKGDLRSRITPKYRFDERWEDLEKCLRLDGYRIEGRSIHKIEPFLEGKAAVLDELVKEIGKSSIPHKEEILKHMNLSDIAFLKTPSDFNGCLSHARIALETLVRSIAESLGFKVENISKAWGASLSYLNDTKFIDKKDENAIASIYTFISEGSHAPIGFSEEEYVRFGRNLSTSISYFIVKLFNKENA